MRNGFGMIFVIIFLVIVAGIGAMVSELSSSTNKQTSNSYLKTQADLLSRSATEYAIMAIQGHDFNNSCLNYINIDENFFDINISLHYFMTDCGKCTNNCNVIKTKDSNASVLITTILTTKPNVSEKIRVVKTTIQKP